MKKKKIYVYAISKNEEKFVDRWVHSMKEADAIYVLDTGSSDKTVSKLKELGVHVFEEDITPWRFDVARNHSLALVPEDADVCVCTDLDEVFLPGWRDTLEQIWQEDTTRLAYNYNWSLDEENRPLVNFYLEQIHARKNYQWTHPVHEVLTYLGKKEEKKITTNEITLNHYPDRTKSRSSYLPLLELSVEEDPEDDRNMHYLGREYMYYGMWEKAITTLKRHLSLKKATWKDERGASMRFIARCCGNLGKVEDAEKWYQNAMKETPYLRDPYMEYAIFCYEQNRYADIISYVGKALQIRSHPKTYINEVFSWDHTPYDLLSIAFFACQEYALSYTACKKALQISPDDERLQSNLESIEKKLS